MWGNTANKFSRRTPLPPQCLRKALWTIRPKTFTELYTSDNCCICRCKFCNQDGNCCECSTILNSYAQKYLSALSSCSFSSHHTPWLAVSLNSCFNTTKTKGCYKMAYTTFQSINAVVTGAQECPCNNTSSLQVWLMSMEGEGFCSFPFSWSFKSFHKFICGFWRH